MDHISGRCARAAGFEIERPQLPSYYPRGRRPVHGGKAQSMKRVAILGANGQVGTEVSLRLRDVEGLEVVPIARNVSGSAFLRRNGMECRHGRISDPAEARSLIGDCDVVVNFALSNTAIPRIDRQTNRQIVRSTVAAAKPGAPIVFASTIMVYAPAMK